MPSEPGEGVILWHPHPNVGPFDHTVAVLGIVALAMLLLGIVRRGCSTRCVSFSLYVTAVLVPSVLMTFWPARFYRWDFYALQEATHAVLKFAIALELTARVFARFPGAIAAARKAHLVVVSLTLLTVLALPSWAPAYGIVLGEIQPRILNGTTWLLAAIAGLVLWYRIPIDPVHKGILLGLAPYLVVFTVGFNAIKSLGWDHPLSHAHTVAYLLVLLYWNRMVWVTREPGGPGAPRMRPRPPGLG